MTTKTQKLQAIADDLRADDQYQFSVEYRPGYGWYAIPEDGPRWFGDEGEYLGANAKDAERSLTSLMG